MTVKMLSFLTLLFLVTVVISQDAEHTVADGVHVGNLSSLAMAVSAIMLVYKITFAPYSCRCCHERC